MAVKHLVRLLSVLALITALAGTSWAKPQAQGYKGYARGSALITAKELKQLIDAKDKKLVIIAAENDVEYRLGHIPGSFQVDRPVYEAPAATQNGVTGNLIDAAGFTRLAQGLGVNKDSKVVVYDTKHDATRLWWAFLYYGKGDVRALDGGVKAWKDAGYDTAILAPDAAKRGSFVARVALPRSRVETPEILALKDPARGQLWDNRDRKEYCGEELKKGAYRKGRIPWGKHSDWAIFKKKENAGEWVGAAEAQAILKKLGVDGKKDQYFFCQSGVRSTQAMFTFYLMGYPLNKLHNYDSSWIGWSKDASVPIETGCDLNPAVATAR
ncbi:sulfurtransferase [Geoanaerobacter pelophilus]|uniref:Sulfurtransferase n=1 Tax=Geoanaerobacter pelophilus TaxID=60036 RepID=A0ABQ0MMF4_9BACT|nr:rhodanese-like domain-containing protein [Geoanaerobacter pelophilus]GAW68267.1 sulfurtransferase [Geoanaerobacter pelophilus]